MTEDYFWGEYDERALTFYTTYVEINVIAHFARCIFFALLPPSTTVTIVCFSRGLHVSVNLYLTTIIDMRLFIPPSSPPGKPKTESHMVRAARSLCDDIFPANKLLVIVPVMCILYIRPFCVVLIFYSTLFSIASRVAVLVFWFFREVSRQLYFSTFGRVPAKIHTSIFSVGMLKSAFINFFVYVFPCLVYRLITIALI